MVLLGFEPKTLTFVNKHIAMENVELLGDIWQYIQYPVTKGVTFLLIKIQLKMFSSKTFSLFFIYRQAF